MTIQLTRGDGVSVAAICGKNTDTDSNEKRVMIAVTVDDIIYYSFLDRDQYIDWARQNYEAAKEAWGAGFAREE